MASGVGESEKAFAANNLSFPSSNEIKKNLAAVLKNTEFVGRSIALVVRHPEYMKKSFVVAMSHPTLATAVREIETKAITTVPGLLPGVPIPLPTELLRAGGEMAASAVACHVGAMIYERILRKKGNEGKELPAPDSETIAISFLQEIAEIEKEANGNKTLR